MSLWILGRFWPRSRVIPRRQAVSSPRAVSQAALMAAVARRPVRSLNTIRDLAAVAVLAGLFEILYFKKNSDDSSGMKLSLDSLSLFFLICCTSDLAMNNHCIYIFVSGEEKRKDLPDKKPVNEPVTDASNRAPIKQEDMKEVSVNAGFKNNGNDFSLENYPAEMTEVAAAHRTLREREMSDKTVNKAAEMEVLNEGGRGSDEGKVQGLDEGIRQDLQN